MSKLIGTNPNQVPSNADLGTAAFMDKTEFLLSKGSSLSAIDAVIPKTAADIFIYDTTKDSDGGAWRKNTQHTSWYKEKLNTTVRGSRREFPAVALIVLEANNTDVTEGQTVDLTIYDADDPSLPMWMEVRFGISGNGSSNTCVSALNGHLVFGRTNNGILIIDFIADTLRVHNHVHRHTYSYIYPSRLGRTAPRSVQKEMSITGFNIINEYVNDVAMTVVTNSDMHVSGSLPVPTIAVATNGGVAVIKSDYNIAKITASAGSAYNGVSWVDFTENYNIIFEQDNSTNPRSAFCIPIPTSDRTSNTNDGSIGDKVILKFYDNGAHVPYPTFNGGGVIDAVSMSGDNQAFRSGIGDSYAGSSETKVLTLLEPDLQDPEQGRVAYITSDHNTGWMTGDNRLSTLSDTDATDISGNEIVVNNDFSSGTSNWTIADAGEGSISASGGQLTLTNSTTANPPVACYQAISLTPGKYYTLESDCASGLAPVVNIVDTVNPTGGAGGYGNTTYHDTVPSKRRTTFKATSQTNFIMIRVNTNSTGTTVMNSVSITEAAADRGPYGRFLRDRMSGLRPIGTIKKTPVATGADLVSYTGFNTTNYFTNHMPWSIGTGDFSFQFWIKPSLSPSGYFHVVSIGTESTSGQQSSTGVVLKLNASDSSPYFYSNSGASQSTYNSSANAVIPGKWNNLVGGRKNGVWYIYINGVLKTTGNNNAFNIADRFLTIGHGIGMTETQDDVHVSLLRISKTFPDSEHIKKMYEDEKQLFNEDSKAILYGTSDAVEAFAYDDDTKLLHVGTSDGRSDFRGLQRINNTTRAVGTAISAVDGFMVEE